MNGYVKFESPDGEPIVVNADVVNFVRRFRGGNAACAIRAETQSQPERQRGGEG